MRRVLGVLLCLTLPALAAAEDLAPLPTLDSGGHTGRITRLLFTPDGKRLVSVSLDRTVRLWDVASGEGRGVLRLPAFPAGLGQLHAAALTPDGRLLAVGGATTRDQKSYEVDLLVASNGTLERRLIGHTGTITSLGFSPDGKRLAAGDAAGKVRLWDPASGKCRRVLDVGEEAVVEVAFAADGRLATACGGGRIWSADGSKCEAQLAEAADLTGLAWSPDGKTLAGTCSTTRCVCLWQPDGNLRRRINLPGEPLACTFSADSRKLLVGLHEGGALLLDLGDDRIEQKLPGVFAGSGTVALAPDGALAAGVAGDAADITLWKTADGSVARVLRGKGRTVWSVGWGSDQGTIAWGDEGSLDDVSANATRALRYTLYLPELTFRRVPEEEYQRARQKPGNPPEQGSIQTGFLYRHDSRTLATLFGWPCAALLPEDRAAVGGPGLLEYSLRDGHVLKRLQGHEGTIHALSSSPYGHYLLSGSEDQTVSVWNPDQDQPLMSVFAGGGDWVAWTPQGYYAGSPGGERMLGWQVDNGPDQPAGYYPAAAFHKSLYRPDLLALVLTEGSVDQAREKADVAAKRTDGGLTVADGLPPRVEITQPLAASGDLPSQFELRAVAVPRSRAHPIKNLRLQLDGRPYEGNKGSQAVTPAGPEGQAEAAWSVKVPPGKHRLEVYAETDVSEGVSAPLETAQPQQRGNLYALAVGISSYPYAPSTQAAPATKAAEAAGKFKESLTSHGKGLYRNVEVRTLTDKEATARDIREQLQWLRRQMTPTDVGLVFFAGEGFKDAHGKFYLEPSDFRPDDPRGTGLLNAELMDELKETHGQVVLLLDCYPPRNDADTRKSTGRPGSPDETPDAVREASTPAYGLAVLLASEGREAEGDTRRRGFFAQAVIQGLTSSEADANHDGQVDLRELEDYVKRRVVELSGDKQHPLADVPPGLPLTPLTLVSSSASSNGGGKEVDAESDRVPDTHTAVVEVDLPAGAHIVKGGKETEPGRIQFGSLIPGQLTPAELTVRFADQSEVTRSLRLQGGWWVRLPLFAPASARPEVLVQTGHSDALRALAVSRDGKYVVTGSDDQTAILWETATGRQLRTFVGQRGPVEAVAFSPDGKQVLTGSADHSAILWETASGKALRTLTQHQGTVFAVAFSPDGKQLLTGSGDQTAILWDAVTGQPLHTFTGHHGNVTAVAFSADGKRLLTGSADQKAMLWEVGSGKVVQTLAEHHGPVFAVAFSPDGKQLLTGSGDQTAILWDATTGKVLHVLKEHGKRVTAAAFSPDGKQAITGSEDRTARLWDTAEGKSRGVLRGHEGSVTAVAFHPDGKRVLTASADQTAALWDAEPATQVLVFRGRTKGVTALALSADGNHLLVGGGDPTAGLWDLRSGKKTATLRGHLGRILSVAVSADGNRALTGSEDGRAILWDAVTARQLQVFQNDPGRPTWVTAVALSPDGGKALVGCRDSSLALWDTATGKRLAVLTGHTDWISGVAFSPDGKQVLSGSHDQTAILWETATGQQVRVLRGQHRDAVEAVAFSPDGKQVLTGSEDRTAILWDAGTGQVLRTFKDRHRDGVGAVAFGPDGKQVLTGSDDGTAVLWNAGSGAWLATFQGHAGAVQAVLFSRDGRRLVTGSADGTVRLWDLATGDELARLVGLDGGQDWLAVTPEGLFDGSEGGREKVAYRIDGGLMVVAVDRFFQSCYRAGLLALLWQGERPVQREVEIGKTRAPRVQILKPAAGGAVETPEVTLEAEAIDQGSGVGSLKLYHNGARLRDPGEVIPGGAFRRRFKVALVEGENRLEVRAASADGGCESETASLVLLYQRAQEKPDLYLLAVGINNYEQMPLQFAADDARQVADLFTQRGPDLYGHVHVTRLLNEQATQAGVQQAFEQIISQAQPQDTLLVFLAGHGITRDRHYYFLPQEFQRRAGKSLEEDLRQEAVAIDDVGDYLGRVAARKRVFVFDTCGSGGALGALTAARNPFALNEAVQRLSHGQGVYAIAAASADDEAKESPQLGHGILTYTLLAGLDSVTAGPLKEEGIHPSNAAGVVSVQEWFDFAEQQMPGLTRQYCNRMQVPEVARLGPSIPLLTVPKHQGDAQK